MWIVWLGWFSRTRHNIYLGEILFRIFNTALLYTVFRWVFTFNVPPHNVGIPLTVVHSIVFKELVKGREFRIKELKDKVKKLEKKLTLTLS